MGWPHSPPLFPFPFTVPRVFVSLGKGDGEAPEPSVPHQASILALGSPGSFQELSVKAEGFPQTPQGLCSLPAHPVHPAGQTVLFCRPMSPLELQSWWPELPALQGPSSEVVSLMVLVSQEAASHVLLVEALGGGDGARRPVDHYDGQQVVQGELPGKAGGPSQCRFHGEQELPLLAVSICQAPCPPGLLPQTLLQGQGCCPCATGRAG